MKYPNMNVYYTYIDFRKIYVYEISKNRRILYIYKYLTYIRYTYMKYPTKTYITRILLFEIYTYIMYSKINEYYTYMDV
jgi:hypothetical protein